MAKPPAKKPVKKNAPCKVDGNRLTPQAKAFQKLDKIGIDEICIQITSGLSGPKVAAKLGVTAAHFAHWLARDLDCAARARQARVLSAQHWDEEAEKVLDELPRAGLPGEVVRARELASHYRWRASKYAPRDYGDKTILSGDPDSPLIPVAKPDLSKLTKAELVAYIALQAKAEGKEE